MDNTTSHMQSRQPKIMVHQRWLLLGFLFFFCVGLGFVAGRNVQEIEEALTAGENLATTDSQRREWPVRCEQIHRGWQAQVISKLPETIFSLAVHAGNNCRWADIFAGTGPNGGVYCINPSLSVTANPIPLSAGLGDLLNHGTCHVESLLVSDLNGDGQPELVASTSQVNPRGRPCVFVWSIGKGYFPLAFARPTIASSWSHGLGALPLGGDGKMEVVGTYCGYGEVVEYQLIHQRSKCDHQVDALRWRKVGQLPISGEQAMAADADNDGQVDLLLATGYAPTEAAIHVYSRSTDKKGTANVPSFRLASGMWQQRHLLQEEKRFANVRFTVGSLGKDGVQDILAWWCTGLAGGECEIVRYVLQPQGIRARIVIAEGAAQDLWPLEQQIVMGDVDGDGISEAYFATHSGNVWQFDPRRPSDLTRLGHFNQGIGALAITRDHSDLKAVLFLGCGRELWKMIPQAAPQRETIAVSL